MITDSEIREVYREDTVGRKYHAPIISKNNGVNYKGECSEPMTLKLNEPMNWEQFKALSDSLKIKYITHLKEQFNISNTALSQLFGVAPSTVYNEMQRLDLGNLFKRKHMRADELERFNEFAQQHKVQTTTKSDMSCCEFSFSFTGTFDSNELVRYLKQIINDGDKCDISVSVVKR